MHADKVEEIPKLYAAGADYVLVSRLLEAEELMGLLDAADKQLLDQKRKAQAQRLENRSEVLA